MTTKKKFSFFRNFFYLFKVMRLLELFSGTGSVRKAVGNRFDEIISIDILQKFEPTEAINILDWDYRKYPTGHFEAIWASPPCTQYSIAKSQGVRDIVGANAIVKRTLEIIEYFKPTVWFMENPQTGLLKKQDVVKNIPFYDVDYCQYGMLYRKRTRIWTNKVGFTPRLCDRLTCPGMNGTRHKLSCGNGFKVERPTTLAERYSIPSKLIIDLFD